MQFTRDSSRKVGIPSHRIIATLFQGSEESQILFGHKSAGMRCPEADITRVRARACARMQNPPR